MICEKIHDETIYTPQYAKRFYRFKSMWKLERRREQRKRIDELIRYDIECLDALIKRFSLVVNAPPNFKAPRGGRAWSVQRYIK